MSYFSFGQKAKIFTLADFDLSGPVKTCFVIKDYGKEEFSFNQNGILTKLVTRYNENDYDITYYKYENEAIREKRVEIYRDGTFDKQTSIANIYSVDSIPNGKKITEKIISYANEFLDQYEYSYDVNDKLIQIYRNDGKGIENTKVSYEEVQGETTISYTLDGELQKTIRTSNRKINPKQKIVLTKQYFEGKLNTATEQVFNEKANLISEQKFVYDLKLNTFVPEEVSRYTYNDLGMLTELKTKKGKVELVKKYIYQYDNGGKGNWVKQIVTPDNTYITRKISYYEKSSE
tara:strand:- start:42491 stop:43360 length:870 start_codon:yes stop_codon:yes gene_type:complete